MNQYPTEVQKIILFRSKLKKPFEMTVSGISMLPILQEGDIISILRKDSYDPGDILVFFYKQNEILVHRLLKIEKTRYFCKGDNSFRLEDISEDQILGAVLLNNDPHHTCEFINDSYRINRIFRSCKYDIVATKQSMEYEIYRKKYLDN